LADRNKLALQLVNTQEEERRYLTRELHDEFGQSLAGLAAIASSIMQTAEKECPQLVKESHSVGKITTQMMGLLKDMLIQLRPIDFDDLGLVESLQSMVAEWNTRSGDKTKYDLDIFGDFSHLPSIVAVNIFRIVQECLTNVSKHSEATKACVKLTHTKHSSETGCGESMLLIIEDNGVAETIEFSASSGIGLLGMRERVAALGGKMTLKPNKPSGLIVRVSLPFQHLIESSI
jgi:signal transduction histidine kinase